jgi:hypothetical protein
MMNALSSKPVCAAARSGRRTVPRHTSAAFVEFLCEIVTSQPKGCEIHVIVDNLATHKTQPCVRS